MMLLRRAAIGTAVLLLLAACGEDADQAAVTEPTEEPDATTGDDTEATDDAQDASAEATVAVASSELGDILVDDQGMTLYMFEPDEAGASTCYDDCADNWPPLIVEGEVGGGEGVDAGLLDTTERDDGSTQVTYDGWPLYHWAGDSASGDTNGQGINDVWWVLAPDGSPIRDDDENASAGTRDGY